MIIIGDDADGDDYDGDDDDLAGGSTGKGNADLAGGSKAHGEEMQT